jgi:hypothetical protein
VVHNATRWRRVAILVILVAFAAGIAQTSAGRSMLRKAGLLANPTSYTSLAFQRPQDLREQFDSKRVDFGVSFEIHNVGSFSRDYQWSVLLTQGSRTRSVAAGSVRIASGRGKAISRSVKVVCSRGQVRIAVKIVQPAEFIDAWVACSPSKKSAK